MANLFHIERHGAPNRIPFPTSGFQPQLWHPYEPCVLFRNPRHYFPAFPLRNYSELCEPFVRNFPKSDCKTKSLKNADSANNLLLYTLLTVL